MARRCVRATSRLTFCFSEKSTLSSWTCLFGAFVLFGAAAEAELYTSSDQVTLLTPENVKSVLVNSSAATVVEFYAAWCGHCIAFSPIYKSLARDIKEWKPAVDVAAFHCMGEENVRVCAAYNVTGFPTVKFFHAYSTPDAVGVAFKGHDVTSLRRRIIDKLETHKEPGPPACPPLEPTSQAEVSSFFETNTSQYLALVFEKPDSYLGRELTLDLLQFENISVRRVLSTEQGLVAELGVTQFPSCYLYHPGGNFTRLEVKAEARTFYFYALQRLPGVVRSGKPPVVIDVHNNKTQEPWRPFNSSRVYMADLESTLHYSLRVELAAHTVIKGRALNPLKNYIGVLAKYFPGRPIVMNTLNSLNSWLQNQSQDEILYKDFKEILDNTAQSPDTALPRGERWVACQGSQPHFRRYPCGMWTLFHVLTVEAKKAEASNQLEVPLAMRNYIHAFFGCRYCAEHFDNLVRGSLLENEAVLWLWSIHNEVNSRLSGALSEDPNFPKIQWPSPDMCPECHNVTKRGEHRWNKDKALRFLLSYFSSNRILPDYLEDETQILAKQREEHASRLLALEAEKKAERRVREAPDLEIQPLPSNPTVQEEEEEEEEEEGEEPQDEAVAEGEEEEGGEGAVAAQESNPWDKPEMAGGERSQKVRRKPSIVGMKIRRNMADHIVDLDLFENQHFKAKALQLAASSRIKRRSLQRKVEPEPGPVFGLGMELDGGVGMVGLQPVDADFDMDVGQQRKWLQKRDLSPTGHWMSTLSIGFSRVDVSLCVLLYFLSCMCLLGMYTFFQHRFRLRRVKFSMS